MKKPRAKYSPAKDGFKVCAMCQTNKPVSEFYPKRGTVESYCKPCKGVLRRERREKFAGTKDTTIEARFWSKVHKEPRDGCWVWTGSRHVQGYGQIHFQGKLWIAHRVSWLLAGNELPDRYESGLVLDHMCKNQPCVRPDHLRLVTQLDNTSIYADRTKSLEKVQCECGRRIARQQLNRHRATLCPAR